MVEIIRQISKILSTKKWAVLIAWQVCSIIMCGCGTICHYLATYYHETIPFLMMAGCYIILLLTSCWRVPKRSKISWWKYLLTSVTLSIGDYVAVLGYNTTSLSSSMLLVTTVVFWVAPLSYYVFGRKINIYQFGAIFLAMTGSILVFVAEGTRGNKWVGNVLALTSAICYSIGTVVQELLVHNESLHTYIFRFSSGATPLAILLSCGFEWNTIKNYYWCTESALLVIGYSVLLAIYDLILSYVMQFSDATTMNLSMLTANFFSLGVSIIFFGQKASWLYLVGFCCVPTAIAIYHVFGMRPKESNDQLLPHEERSESSPETDEIDEIDC
ncbi:Integral membrane protein [Tritrichomonas foetus]|uniref:Integral membrane protein n=1 Tax=Tritrichomonas foetus TaxID=1144522 RepID=A0A1J4K372_9EUKA|nr:Integral membrane protein [Tritrichomonas foetus]|eukprot:OHT05889.1 Integral membrane protein [Tritrichomonas foetus]